jgi:hypothetical protein
MQECWQGNSYLVRLRLQAASIWEVVMNPETIDNIIAGREKLYAPVEVAMILGYKTATVQEMCRTEVIRAKKIGTMWKIPESEIRRFLGGSTESAKQEGELRNVS